MTAATAPGRRHRARGAAAVVALALLGSVLAGCTANDNGGVIVPPPDTTTSAVPTT